MTYSEFLIIYFAFAAPFGMRGMLSLKRPISPGNIVLALANALIWPVTVVSAVFGIVRNALTTAVSDTEPFGTTERELRVTLERAIDWNACGLTVFEFREALERYLGLTKANGDRLANEDVPEIFAIAEHDSPHIASRCLARRNENRLLRHADQARSDLKRFLEYADLPERMTDECSPAMRDLYSEIDLIYAMKDRERAAVTIEKDDPTTAGDIWNTQARSRSAAG